MMTRRRALIFLSVILLLLTGVCGAADFSQLAPDGSVAYLSIRNLTTLRENWKKTPYYRLWQDPEFASFVEPSKKKWDEQVKKYEKELQMTEKELVDLFPGQAAFFVSRISFEKKNRFEGSMGFALEFREGGQEKVRNLVNKSLENLPTDAKKGSMKVQDVTVYTVRYEHRETTPIPGPKAAGPRPEAVAAEWFYLQYAFVDNLLLVAEGDDEPIKPMILALKGKGAPGLAASSDFKKLGQRGVQNPDLFLYLDSGRIFSELLKLVPQDPQSKQGFDYTRLQLENLKALSFALSLEGGAHRSDLNLLLPKISEGASRFFGCFADNKFKLLDTVPDDVLYYSSTSVDWPRLWQAFTTLLAATAPNAKVILDQQLALIAKEMQVDFEKDFVGNLAGEVGSTMRKARFGEKDEYPTLYFAEVGSGDRMKTLLQKLAVYAERAWNSPLEKQDFMGYEIFVPKTPYSQGISAGATDNAPFGITVAGDFLLATENLNELKFYLRRINEKSAMGLGHSEKFTRLRKEFPANVSGLRYSDTARLLNTAISELRRGFALYGAGDDLADYINLDAVPCDAVFEKYFQPSLSALCQLPDGVRFTSYMPAK
ncbi:MAG: DUF3352 domain-containing protein [bacterium]